MQIQQQGIEIDHLVLGASYKLLLLYMKPAARKRSLGSPQYMYRLEPWIVEPKISNSSQPHIVQVRLENPAGTKSEVGDAEYQTEKSSVYLNITY